MRTAVVLMLLVACTSLGWAADGRSFGVLCAQGPENGQEAWSLEFMRGRGGAWDGLALWWSGQPFLSEDVIDTSIPHTDYRVYEEHGSLGLEYLRGSGSPKALFIVGIGAVMDETRFIQVSNVTGWKWNGGTRDQWKVTAQAGTRLELAPGFDLRVGYDSHYRGFGGVAFGRSF